MTGDYVYNQITLRFPVSDFIAEKKRKTNSRLVFIWFNANDDMGFSWEKWRKRRRFKKKHWPKGAAN